MRLFNHVYNSLWKMGKEHICNEPHPEDIETPSKHWQRNRLYHAYNASNNENDGKRFKDLSKLLQNH